MGIIEAANKSHEELFPNHKSTLKATDTGLMEVFDNFTFDEVLQLKIMKKQGWINLLDFSYNNPVTIHFGRDALEKLPEEIKNMVKKYCLFMAVILLSPAATIRK